MNRDGPTDGLPASLGTTRLFASDRSRRRFLVHALVAVALLAGVLYLVRNQFTFLTDAEGVRAFVRSFGVWAPIALVALQALQVVVAPIPGQVLAFVAGYLFGPWWGTLYNVVGITIGSTLAFWLSRRFGRTYVERIVHEDALARFDAIDETHARLTLFLFFLIPGLPDDVICFAGGLTKIPLSHLVVIAIVGRTPAFFLANLVGGYLGEDQLGLALGVAALFVGVTVLGYLNRDRLVELLGGKS